MYVETEPTYEEVLVVANQVGRGNPQRKAKRGGS